MKLIQIVLVLLLFFAESVYSATSYKVNTLQECYQIYSQLKDPGYKSFAFAYDHPYFVCGIASAMPKSKYSAEGALQSCERSRIQPQAEIKGNRAVMTHCRIYATEYNE